MPDAALTPAEAARWTRIGTLAALALLLGYLESFIPIPLPGVKMGLANIAVLVALAGRDVSGAFFVSLIKVLATGLLFGNPVTLAYSATGTLAAFALMAPLALLPTMRIWMVSVAGALAHEAGQLMVAQLLLGTPLVWYGAPPLAVAGCVTGLLCGIAAERTASLLAQAPSPNERPTAASVGGRGSAATMPEPRTSSSTERHTLVCLALYLLFFVVVMHVRRWQTALACLAATIVADAAARLHPHDIRTALAPTAPLALVTFVAQLAGNQQGAPLATLGPVSITKAALGATSLMLVRLVCISGASVAVVRLAGRDGVAAAARRLLRPLRALGLRTQGPELAFSCTMRLIAQLADELPHRAAQHSLLTRAFWTTELPSLVRALYLQASQPLP